MVELPLSLKTIMERGAGMSRRVEKECALFTKHIGKQFNGITVLQDINLSIYKGEIHTLLGANGAGKSTLIKIIDGIYTDYEGEIYVNNRRAQMKNSEDARLLGIGMVHQELSLIPQLNVAENIYLGRLPRNSIGLVHYKKLHENAQQLLALLNLTISTNDLVGRLSIADRQMVEIAKMLSMNAEILLLDEPTSALSDKEVTRLFETLRQLKASGKAIIFITHKLEEIYAISDKVTIMRDGQQIETLDLSIKSPDLEKNLISLMTGTEHHAETIYPGKGNVQEEIVFRIEQYTGRNFHHISLEVRKGEILGIAGLNGAGRTELARAIFGADRKDSGNTYLNGRPIVIKSPMDAIKQGIAMITEDRKKEGFIGCLGVKENINLTTIRDTVRHLLLHRRLEIQKAKKYISKLNIKTFSEHVPVRNLSGGNQQKVILAKWLALDCKLMILDEPTKGIDVKAKSEIYQLMRELAEQGIAIIFISSEFTELIGMADRVLVMNHGKIVHELRNEQITKENIMNHVFKDVV
ncbi:sugar ABC transporter ATP-binding protein [Paenibacillus naphthalenovorans]|uniref:D-ribose transporter ATP-binding protein n=1 Tax=Paenibacillus naphthalenovorans TaxID=162209 RepID=A0A0U2W696_9BACL|nr:sugar ABC transporter ATP-binding protein [Paenibacillus naphthalenovorans]ALS23029.1 D-ribose transporter ATP-binding protein [Paenibacillus naphthalenovorans]